MLEWKILEKGESTAKVVKKGLLRLTELEGAYLYSRNRTDSIGGWSSLHRIPEVKVCMKL